MNQNSIAAALLASLALVAVAKGETTDSAYLEEITAWRAERIAKLRAPDGFLNLAALYWLDDGRYSFGASADNDLVVPNALAERIGYLEVEDGRVTMYVNDGELVLINQRPVKQAVLEPVTDGSPVPAQMGSQFWYVIERVGKLGLRLHDLKNPALERLPPMPYFEIDQRFRVTGRLKPYPEPRQVSVSTVIDGLPYEPESPGVVEFELDGRAFALEAYTSGNELFFVFGDATSGRETYGAGRFLYSPAPGEDGLTVLDFNKSYNPPCAFNDFSTCPIASPRNRLDVRIEAGELYDPSLYVGEAAYQ